MFKNKTKDSSTASAPASAPSGAINSIVVGTSIEGTVQSNNDIRIDGSLKGSLVCKGRVIIGPEGKVDGDISCQNAVVEGKFTGKLKVSELLTVKENAHIEGDINTKKLSVQPGAIYNVTCTMGGQQIKSFEDNKAKSLAG